MIVGLYYKHSGKFSLLAVPAGLFTGLAVGLPVAFVYAYVALYSHYIPFVRWGTFLLAAVFGAVVGLSTSGGLHWGKARNAAVGYITSLVVGLVVFYVSWAVWIYAVLRRVDAKPTLLPLLVYPPLLWHFIVEVSKVGAWTLVVRPTGFVLWILWGIEAAIVLGAAVAVGGILVDIDVFCESCEAWCAEEREVCVLNAAGPGELKQRLEAKDFGYLKKLGARSSGAQAWVRVDLHACPACRATNTLTVKSTTVSVDKEGKKSESSKDVVDRLLISSSEADAIRQLGQKLSAAAAAAASS